MWFEKVKRYYKAGIWNRQMVENAVKKGKITALQYREIVGEPCPGGHAANG